jgi:DNA-binding NtrC family response regulator
MKALRQQIKLMAPTNGRVLIYGESGTGKELIGRTMHAESLRKDRPFVELNCAAIPEDYIESELFGYRHGAIPGGPTEKRGTFERADGGTLFLDEVGDMSLKTQAKVLRALDEQRFLPVGASHPVHVDVRVIAATNKDLEDEIARGNFREDLFYRLNVITVDLPPLRARREDIPLLVNHFLDFYATENSLAPRKLSADALRALVDYEWPGNVRELENSIERGVVLSSGPVIGSDLLPGHITGRSFQDALLEHNPNASLFDILEDIERRIIIEKLERCNWNQTDAAEQFRIPLSTLNQKIKRLNIEIRKKGRE